MKKTYIQPHAEVVTIATTSIIAASPYSGELGSRLSDYMEDDDNLLDLSADDTGSLYIADDDVFLNE